jgi:hypothetical protein
VHRVGVMHGISPAHCLRDGSRCSGAKVTHRPSTPFLKVVVASHPSRLTQPNLGTCFLLLAIWLSMGSPVMGLGTAVFIYSNTSSRVLRSATLLDWKYILLLLSLS